MCGRLNIDDSQSVHDVLNNMGVDFGEFPVRYNIAPTDQIPVIHYWEGKRVISDMRWWLVPSWSSGPTTKFSMFNARSENLETSRAYQGCFRHKRCVIPASSYVEWQRMDKQKTPYCFSRPEGALSLAGLWDYWSDGTKHVLSCSIITTAASTEMKTYHKRMPVLLDAQRCEQWLNEKQDTSNLHGLFESNLPHPLQAVEIDTLFNNSRNKDAPVILGAIQHLA